MVAAESWQGPRAEAGLVQRSLHGVAETARRIDTRDFEVLGHERVRGALVPAVVEAVDRATGVLGEVLDRYDRAPGTPVSDGASAGVFADMFDELVEHDAPAGPQQRIADMSFMARWELERKRKAVREAAGGSDEWRLIAECCSARRRVIKAATGVERVLAEVEAIPSLFGDLYQTETQRALDTRAAYYSFVIGLRATEGRRDEVERCVRLAGTGIARLIGREIYQELRIEDRRSLRDLQARLFAWLRGDRDRRDGQRLHSEVLAFGSLLMEVNRRAALVEHDRAVLEDLLAAVAEPPADVRGVYRLLRSVRGRSPELDALIENQAALRPELWSEPVAAVLAGLADSFTG